MPLTAYLSQSLIRSKMLSFIYVALTSSREPLLFLVFRAHNMVPHMMQESLIVQYENKVILCLFNFHWDAQRCPYPNVRLWYHFPVKEQLFGSASEDFPRHLIGLCMASSIIKLNLAKRPPVEHWASYSQSTHKRATPHSQTGALYHECRFVFLQVQFPRHPLY